MVTATITPDTTPPTFPKLMIAINDSKLGGRVVLFTEERKGTVVKLSDFYDTLKVGEFSDSWIMDYFTDFSGTITLKNS